MCYSSYPRLRLSESMFLCIRFAKISISKWPDTVSQSGRTQYLVNQLPPSETREEKEKQYSRIVNYFF